MPNSATLQDTYELRPEHLGYVSEYKIVVTDTGQDIVVLTPSANNRVNILGVLYAEHNPIDLLLKSSASPSKSHTFEMSANQGLIGTIDNVKERLWATKPGEPLVIQSTGEVTSMIFYVTETSEPT